ncbi:MAG: ABC transporter substrate-binding protein [Erysipelothrix sp.]|nr:ABC transporter substrate-binding protein [Erysipelothrix sp.]
MKKITLITILFLLLVGCSQPAASTQTETITITDNNGPVDVPFEPKRIVSFDYAVLDFMQLVDYEVEALGAVVNSAPDYLKDYVSNASEIGGLKEPNLEKIAAFKPDVIFISSRTADFYDDLKKIAPVVYMSVDNQKMMEDVKRINTEFSKIFNQEEKTETLLSQLTTLVTQTKQLVTTKNLKTLILMTNDGNISAFGKGSRFGFLFDELGIINVDPQIESATHGQEVSYEYILQTNPELILAIDRGLLMDATVDAAKTLSNELVNQTQAALNNRIKSLDPNRIYLSAGGIQSIMGTVTEIKIIFESIQ